MIGLAKVLLVSKFCVLSSKVKQCETIRNTVKKLTMPRKEATCKKCNQPLKGHLKKSICPSEHGHLLTVDGKYTCSHKSCSKTFTTLYTAHKHSNSSTCKYFEGTEIPVPCPNNCGKEFNGTGARQNALIHSNGTSCAKHPDRINNPTYRTTVSHKNVDNEKYCNQCKLTLPVENFAPKENSKNYTQMDYVCYKCRACLAMRQGVINRAKKEGNDYKDITLDYIKSLLNTYCPVLGIPLQYGGSEQCDNSATIDAVVHSKGHVKDNLVVISKKANTIKNNSTLEEMDKLLFALKSWEAPHIDDTPRSVRKKGAATTKEQTTKECSLCRIVKAIEMFHKSKTSTAIGISNKCIRCTSLSSMIKNAKQRCVKSGRPLEIDSRYLYAITQRLTHCPVLGIELLFGGTGSIKDGSASIDRFDTSKGYVKDNVWIISYKANRMKSDATIEEIEKVGNYMRLHS